MPLFDQHQQRHNNSMDIDDKYLQGLQLYHRRRTIHRQANVARQHNIVRAGNIALRWRLSANTIDNIVHSSSVVAAKSESAYSDRICRQQRRLRVQPGVLRGLTGRSDDNNMRRRLRHRI